MNFREPGFQVQGMWSSFKANVYIATGIGYTASANYHVPTLREFEYGFVPDVVM